MLLEQTLQYSFIQAAAIILIIVALESLWQIPAKYDPLTFLRLLGTRLAFKVNHPVRGKLQNCIAGSLGFFMLVAPVFIMLYLALEIVHFRWFFDALILFFALSSSGSQSVYKRIYKYLLNQNKVLARECLSSIVLRKTDRLTPLGCAKAAMEASSLRFFYQFSTIVFWFFFVGPLFALFVRIVYEFHHTWNRRLPQFQYFGQPVATLNSLLQWLPCAFHSLLFSLMYRPFNTLKQWLFHFHLSSRHLILACTAYALPCELGGPVIYNERKVRFKRHCETVEVKLGHMQVLKRYQQFLTIVLVLSYILLSLALYSSGIDISGFESNG